MKTSVSRPFLLVLSLLLGACSAGGGGVPQDPVPPGRGSPRAIRFEDCAALQQYLTEVAAQQAGLERLSDGLAPVPGGAGSGGATVDAGAGEGAAAPDPDVGAGEFTGTNVQEPGVDETDFVKTDGEYLYLLTGGFFLVYDAWPADETTELSRRAVAGQPLGLFVSGKVAAVLTQSWQYEVVGGFVPRSATRIDLVLFDLTDPAAPAKLRNLALEGGYSAARMVAGRLHLVLSTQLDLLAPMPLPLAEGISAPAGGESEVPSQLIPGYADTRYSDSDSVVETDTLCPCENFYRPAVPNGTGIVTLVTLDLTDPLGELHSVALAGNDGVVYGSGDSIYLATRNDDAWFWLPVAADEDRDPAASTVIHRFSLGAEPTYQASGEVDGWVLNSYSMSEYQGVFRVATTDDNWWRGGDPVNAVNLLRQEGDRLEVVGSLGSLGKPGERIYAVRFLGPRGYVVTFRQVDPLYALDLSDPTRPAVAGALAVPGFSTYLHPVGDTHLLAVGQHTDPWGVELSLFDVGDPAHPALVDREFLGEGSYSEAQYEPKAFTYFDAVGALAIPAVTWNLAPDAAGFADSGVFAGAYVYDVDLTSGFTRRGAVTHTEFYQNPSNSSWYYPEPVRRSFFIRDAGASPFLYTVSRRGLKVTGLDDLTRDLAAHDLPAEEVYWLDVLAVE